MYSYYYVTHCSGVSMRHQVSKQKKMQDCHDKIALLTVELTESYRTNARVTCLLQQAYHDIHDLKVMLRELSNDASVLLSSAHKKTHVLDEVVCETALGEGT